MSTDTLLITGASGHLGKLVLETLLKGPKRNIIATSRNPEKLANFTDKGVTVRGADFENADSLVEAFKGATRLLLISTDTIGSRVVQHKNAIDAAKKAGVKHIIYTSYPSPEDSVSGVAAEHFETEKLIQQSGLSYTILENFLYADNLLMSLPNAVAFGAFIGTAGTGKNAYVTREDCARVAAAALASSNTKNEILKVSGPRAITNEELAQITSEVVGKQIPYKDLPEADFKGALMQSGLPEVWAQLYVSFDLAQRKGELAQPTSVVKDLTGIEAKDIATFLKENKAALLGQK